MPEPNPTVLISQKSPFSFSVKYIGVSLAILLTVLTIFLLITPLNLYLNISSLLIPQPLKINGEPISWDQFRQEILLAGLDKNLKTRGQKLERAIDNSVRLQIMRSAIATPSTFSTPLTLFAEHRSLKDQVEQNLVNWRTGGYFIAKFLNPEASESAQVLQGKARVELTKLQQRLKSGADIKTLIKEAEENPTLSYLNRASYLPGMYLEKITSEKFPLKIKSFRERFFSMTAPQVSEIVTLSWDDYDGPSYGEEFKGEFAYAVIKMDEVNSSYSQNYDEWLLTQKQKIKMQSFVWIPLFFNWF